MLPLDGDLDQTFSLVVVVEGGTFRIFGGGLNFDVWIMFRRLWFAVVAAFATRGYEHRVHCLWPTWMTAVTTLTPGPWGGLQGSPESSRRGQYLQGNKSRCCTLLIASRCCFKRDNKMCQGLVNTATMTTDLIVSVCANTWTLVYYSRVVMTAQIFACNSSRVQGDHLFSLRLFPSHTSPKLGSAVFGHDGCGQSARALIFSQWQESELLCYEQGLLHKLR